jgi:hypothetical protein
MARSFAGTSPALVVRSEVQVNVRTTVDLVAWFAGFDPAARAAYWAVDLGGLLDSTWERPTAYLDYVVTDAAEEVMVPVCAAFSGRTTVDADAGGACVQQRDGSRASGPARTWTEDDFETLVSAVPWLSPAADGLPPETMNVPFEGLESLTA